MVTVVLTVTAAVAIVNVPVNPLSGTVTVAGTLATAGLLLDSETTAPPNGAPTLRTTVPLESLPPNTDDGLVSSDDNVAGGGAACGVRLRTVDHGPATPLTLTPRARAALKPPPPAGAPAAGAGSGLFRRSMRYCSGSLPAATAT